MYGDDGFGLQKFAGDDCILGVHGEVAADGDDGRIKRVETLQELHVAEQGGVTCIVQLGAIKVYDKATSVTACNATAVEGERDANLAKWEGEGAAQVHAMGFATVFTGQNSDFVGGDNGGVVCLCNFKCISDVVEVRMADEDVIAFNVCGLEAFGVAV